MEEKNRQSEKRLIHLKWDSAVLTGFTKGMSKKKDIIHSYAKSKEWQHLRTHRKCLLHPRLTAREYIFVTASCINLAAYLSGSSVERDANERAEAESGGDGQSDQQHSSQPHCSL